MTVTELLGRMSGQELADWMAYEELRGPLGPARGDWQAAVVASTIANVNRGKRGKRVKVADLLLKWRSSRLGRQSAEEMEAVGRDLAMRLGGEWTEGPAREGVTTGGDD